MNSIDDLEVALEQRGAVEALTRLRKYLNWCLLQEKVKDMKMGIQWSIESIDQELDILLHHGGAK
jgi:hypothetical protein